MGFLTPNYNKPGKGVEKDAPESKRPILFFEIFWNNLSKLFKAHLCFLLAALPILAGLFLTFEINVNSHTFICLKDNAIDPLGVLLLVLSVFITFPASLGFTYVLRNIQKRQHAWVWSDFIKQSRLNYLSGVKNGITTFVVYFLLINAYGMYKSGVLFGGLLSVLFTTLMLVFIVLFTWMQFYVNTLIVTFDLKLRTIYKNALIFAVGKLPLNLLISLICLTLVLLAILFPIMYILFWLIGFSLLGFIVVFCVYPTIDKYMISKSYRKEKLFK